MAKIVKRKVSWTASDAPDVVGYRVYFVESPAQPDYSSPFAEVGNVTSIVLPDAIPTMVGVDTNFVLGVSAVDDVGNESDISVVSSPLDFIAPNAPSNIMVTVA